MKSKEELLEYAKALEVLKERRKYSYYDFLFSEEGEYSRHRYPKHVEFMNSSGKYQERLFSAGNQTGKTTAILWEGVTHLRLSYPKWWEGKRFRTSTVIIFGAATWPHLRDGIQAKLMGETEEGTGIIPKSDIVKTVAGGIPGSYSQIWVKNKLGGISKAVFKTYEAGQQAWESMTVHGCFFDEEPPLDIYVEGSIRTMRNDGVVAIGFTPDSGLTDTVLHFFKNGDFSQGAGEGKYIIMVGWDDVPHLKESAKKAMMDRIPPYLREAKAKGIPYLGSGKVFATDIEKMVIPAFRIPVYYERFYGFDPGISNSAVVWVARDPETDSFYVYEELLLHDAPLHLVAEGIKSRGKWIHGAVDPFYSVQKKALGVGDVNNVYNIYRGLGLNVHLAERNTKESGIEAIRLLLLSGRLKFFDTCPTLKLQMSLYHRNEKMAIGNTPDDLVDALRYALTYGKEYGRTQSDVYEEMDNNSSSFNIGPRDPITGY